MVQKTKASKKQPHRSSRPTRTYLLAVAFFIALVFALLSQSLWRAFPMHGDSKWLVIEKGQTYNSFINQLGKDGVRFVWILKLYQKVFIQQTMKAGVYQIHAKMNVQQVLTMLSDADNSEMNQIQVIEGTSFRQLKKRLLNDPYVKVTILQRPEAEVMQRLGSSHAHGEGLFAPNTYFFNKGETDLNILQRLYDKQTALLDQAWAGRANNLPYENKYQALIMASIIEKETGLARERKKVAGVFVRRLNMGMRLQTDPTVIYGMGERYKGKISKQDLRTPTAYNTYTMEGLPPTPIALPSAEAIEAALHPAAGRELYFVATGKGGHKFSETLEQHNQAVAEYLKVIRAKP